MRRHSKRFNRQGREEHQYTPLRCEKEGGEVSMQQPERVLCQGTLDSFLGIKRKRQTAITSFLKPKKEMRIETDEESQSRCQENDDESMISSQSDESTPQRVDQAGNVGLSTISVKLEPKVSRKQSNKKRTLDLRYPDQVVSSRGYEDGQKYVGKRIAKAFERQLSGNTIPAIHYGTVSRATRSLEPRLWHIQYDDGDEEEMEEHEITSSLTLYQLFERYDRMTTTPTKSENGEHRQVFSPKQKRMRYMEDLTRRMKLQDLT
eukprot:scaffold4204_cov140-Cylindrotheca_fusiformis.AAC.9